MDGSNEPADVIEVTSVKELPAVTAILMAQCSPGHPVTPDQDTVTAILKRGGWLFVARDEVRVVGLALVRGDSSQVVWITLPDNGSAVEVCEQLLNTALAISGRPPWGTVRNEELRNRLLTSPHLEPVNDGDPDTLIWRREGNA